MHTKQQVRNVENLTFAIFGFLCIRIRSQPGFLAGNKKRIWSDPDPK
jgi:hypothetical protein